jgi:hypothetical protein
VSKALRLIIGYFDSSEYSAYLSRLKRTDERTRTADLLITSDRSRVAGVCRQLQNSHSYADFSASGCPMLHRIAFPVVSRRATATV